MDHQFFLLLLTISQFINVATGFNVAQVSSNNNVQMKSSRTTKTGIFLPSLHSRHDRHVSSNSINTISTSLKMGLFDFLKSRDDDFVKLEQTSVVGPGPLIIFYNIPNGLLDEELEDMIDDGIPSARRNGNGKVKFTRIFSSDLDSIGDMTVKEVLDKVVTDGAIVKPNSSTNGNGNDNNGVPILYFSGISNTEMMQAYNIIAREIYEESGGTANAACAKVVEPAMGKCFRQLLEEVSGDHQDAMLQQES
jgi:hypothetical protein